MSSRQSAHLELSLVVYDIAPRLAVITTFSGIRNI